MNARTKPLRGGAVRGQGPTPPPRLGVRCSRARLQSQQNAVKFPTRDAQGQTGLRSLYTLTSRPRRLQPGAVTLWPPPPNPPSVAETVGTHAWWDVAQHPDAPSTPQIPTPVPQTRGFD